MHCFTYMKYTYYTYLFKFKLSLHLLLLHTLRYELKSQNLMWLDLAGIDNFEKSRLLLFLAQKLLNNTILHDSTLHQHKRNS